MSRIGRTIRTLHAEQDIPVGSINAPFMVKNKHGERASSGVITLEFNVSTGGTTFGNTLIVNGSSELSKGNITAIKDNAGNTWTQLNSITSTEPKQCCLDLWMATNIAAKSPYKVEITTSQTAGAFTAEVIEYAGVFELDTIETVNTAKTEEGFETTANLVEKQLIIQNVSTAICEKLKVGMGVSGGSIPALNSSPLTPVTTIVSITAAKEEVKLSAAPTITEAGIIVTFGQAAIKTPSLTLTAGDVVFLNYSGQIVGPGLLVAAEVKPVGVTGVLPMTGFNTNGFVGYWFQQVPPFELPIATAPVSPTPYSLQIAGFKFAPNNRGVAGTNALGELLGKLSSSTGKMDPTIQTAIPSFVDVGPTTWQTMSLSEEFFEGTPGKIEGRGEATASLGRLRGTGTMKVGAEYKESGRMVLLPAAAPPVRPAKTAGTIIAYGPSVAELTNLARATINTEGELSLPFATTIKAAEVGKLSAEITEAAEITELPTTALSFAIASGVKILLSSGGHEQEWKTTAEALKGVTKILVTKQKPNFNYPNATPIKSGQIVSFDCAFATT